MPEEIRQEIQAKIKELEWTTSVKSILMIEWLNGLLAKTEVKSEPTKKEVVIEIPEVEEKPTPKKKISFRKKQNCMWLRFEPTDKQAEALTYRMDNTTTEI